MVTKPNEAGALVFGFHLPLEPGNYREKVNSCSPQRKIPQKATPPGVGIDSAATEGSLSGRGTEILKGEQG
jgi:hypothetical protein